MRKSISGFTIVELLIVIVVIGILAAISILAYNGIQERAYASKGASIVDSYAKVLEMYKVDHGEYPLQDGTVATYCLGSEADFLEDGAFSSGQCTTSTEGGVTSSYDVSESLNALLDPYVSTLPSGLLPTISYASPDGGFRVRGVVYISQANYTDGQPVPGGAWLSYYVKKDQDCPRGEKHYIGDVGGITLNATRCSVPLGFSLADYY